jgi:plastocyanin
VAGYLHGSGEITRTSAIGFLLACVGLLTACSKPPANTPTPESQPSPQTAPAASGGNTLTVVGRSPQVSGGFPSIVILEPLTEGELSPQTDVPFMDQVQQTFSPPILIVRTGQPTEFRNNDDVLHNVRVREDETRSGAFNVAIPTGEKYVFTFPRDGFYDVGCDIHPGMSAEIISTSSPYAAIADPQGGFVIERVPPGSYKAVMYARGQKVERVVTIAEAHAEIDLTTP